MKDDQILDSWKEITEYLGRSRKTCLRWEKEFNLPIHRLDGTPKARVFAYQKELDRWLAGTFKKNGVLYRLFPLVKTKRQAIMSFSVLASVILLILGVVIWKPFSSPKVSLLKAGKSSLAVFGFENQSGDTSYDYLCKAIPNLLITNIENTNILNVVTWERLNDLLEREGKHDIEAMDKEIGFMLCRKEGIEAVALGSFTVMGDIFATDVKIIDVKNKNLILSTSSKGKGVDSILKTQIDNLSLAISQGFGKSLMNLDNFAFRIQDVSTSSMEAYTYYLKGRETYRKLYYDDAFHYFKKAVELNPNFATAWLNLGGVSSRIGNSKMARQSYIKAKELSYRATEKERLYIDATYADAIERNGDKKFLIFQEIATKFPMEKNIHYLLGDYYCYAKGMYDKGLEEFEKELELNPAYDHVFNYIGIIYSKQGKFKKAFEYLQKYESLSPGEANPHDSMAWVYLSMGALDKAIAKYEEALAIKPDFGSDLNIAFIYGLKGDYSEAMRWIDQYIAMAPSPGYKAEGYLRKGMYHYLLGAHNQALFNLNKAEELALSVGRFYIPPYIDIVRAWIAYDHEHYEQCRKDLTSFTNQMNKRRPVRMTTHNAIHSLNIGLVDIKQDRINAAKIRLAEAKSLLPNVRPTLICSFQYKCDLLQAAVMLAEGSFDEAITHCKKTLFSGSKVLSPPGFGAITRGDILALPHLTFKDILARIYYKKGELEKAIKIYERLVQFDPSYKELTPIDPRFFYRLAKLYEEKGSHDKAKEQYEKFLELWKDADSGRVEVEDARERLARLNPY
jgi:tetratricopeptide (TPR) repeat protein